METVLETVFGNGSSNTSTSLLKSAKECDGLASPGLASFRVTPRATDDALSKYGDGKQKVAFGALTLLTLLTLLSGVTGVTRKGDDSDEVV